MSSVATLVPTSTSLRLAEPPADKPGLEHRAALAAVIAEGRGAVEAALRDRRRSPRHAALRLWRAEDRDALQPRFLQLGVADGDGVRWERAILLRSESQNPLYRASKDRLLGEGLPDAAATVLAELARTLSGRVPCHVVDPLA